MWTVYNTVQLCGHLAVNRLQKLIAPSALSPLTARDHPETRLVSVSIYSFLRTWPLNGILISSDVTSYLIIHIIFMSLVCVWHPGVVAMSRALSSLLPGECVWGESCPSLSWTQMCWTACTRWAVSETESSSHVICNVKSKRLFFSTLNEVFLSSQLYTEWPEK